MNVYVKVGAKFGTITSVMYDCGKDDGHAAYKTPSIVVRWTADLGIPMPPFKARDMSDAVRQIELKLRSA